MEVSLFNRIRFRQKTIKIDLYWPNGFSPSRPFHYQIFISNIANRFSREIFQNELSHCIHVPSRLILDRQIKIKGETLNYCFIAHSWQCVTLCDIKICLITQSKAPYASCSLPSFCFLFILCVDISDPFSCPQLIQFYNEWHFSFQFPVFVFTLVLAFE